MCISDWRLGRQIRCEVTVFASGALTSKVFQPNMQRAAISCSQTNVVSTSGAGMSLTFLNGAVFASGLSSPIIMVSLMTHGDMPTRGFTAAILGTLNGATVVEYFLPEEVLAAGLAEFRRMLKL